MKLIVGVSVADTGDRVRNEFKGMSECSCSLGDRVFSSCVGIKLAISSRDNLFVGDDVVTCITNFCIVCDESPIPTVIILMGDAWRSAIEGNPDIKPVRWFSKIFSAYICNYGQHFFW